MAAPNDTREAIAFVVRALTLAAAGTPKRVVQTVSRFRSGFGATGPARAAS